MSCRLFFSSDSAENLGQPLDPLSKVPLSNRLSVRPAPPLTSEGLRELDVSSARPTVSGLKKHMKGAHVLLSSQGRLNFNPIYFSEAAIKAAADEIWMLKVRPFYLRLHHSVKRLQQLRRGGFYICPN